jgi:activating signal cointegrator 1
VKAISLWQPWASLIACGMKPYETRHWSPPRELIGQTIAIHAAKKRDKDGIDLAEELTYQDHVIGDTRFSAQIDSIPDDFLDCFGQAVLPLGRVVCTAKLEAAFQLGEEADGASVPAARIVRRLAPRPMLEYVVVPRDRYGDYSAGRWAWLLTDVKPLLQPPPAIGRQGFFDLPQGWLTADAA